MYQVKNTDSSEQSPADMHMEFMGSSESSINFSPDSSSVISVSHLFKMS